jgi:hypothetical protein
LADLIIGVLLLLFCLYYTLLTNQLPGREIPGMIGVAFMPRLLTIVLASLALLLAIQGFRRWRRGPERSHPQDPGLLLRPALALVTLLAYPAAMAYGGFLMTTPIFFGTFMALAGGRGARRILLVSLVATATVYVGFHYAFQVPLPKSVLFF